MRAFGNCILFSAICLFFVIAVILPVDALGGEPYYTIKRTTKTIYADGNIVEDDWKAAESISNFVFPWYEEGNKEQTAVKLLWDNEFLYVCFRCEDENISAHHFERNSSVFLDDCAEIFMSPNPKKPMWYANYELNCIGSWLVGLHKGAEKYRWEPAGILVGRSHKGTINKEDDTDSYWILEIAIPFKNFLKFGGRVPPQAGDTWGLNLNRCGGDINPQFSQWTASKTPRPNFHRPEDFGTVVFSSMPVR